MIKTAITGNIASGKSQVEKILLSLGFKVIDSDKINHELLTKNKEVIKEIKSAFGSEIFNSSGEIIKQKLADIIFTSIEKKQILESILHKRIIKTINNFFEENQKEKIIFASVPLLFEAKWENNFDKIIFVSAPYNERLKRLIKRNNLSEEQAKQRINAQQSEEEKIKKSDFVIYNNSDFVSLNKSVINILSNLSF